MSHRYHGRMVGVLIMLCVLAVFVVSCSNAGLSRSKQKNRTKAASAASVPLSWRAISPPSKVAGGFLASVSCVSQKFCVAVGSAPSAPSPGPPHEYMPRTPPRLPSYSYGAQWLSGVWRTARDHPPKLLSYSNGVGSVNGPPSYPGSAVIETFSGNSWHDARIQGPVDNSALSAVSCASKRFCVAVGFGPTGAVIATFRGKRWSTIQAASSKRANSYVVLNAVSCVSAKFCAAVGYGEADMGGDLPVTETFDGSSWRVVVGSHKLSVPRSMSSMYEPYISGEYGWYYVEGLNGVSCVSWKFCVAVGSAGVRSDTSTGGSFPMVDAYNGKTWKTSLEPIEYIRQPPWDLWLRKGHAMGLVGISCSSAKSCVAVGSWRSPACTCMVAQVAGEGRPPVVSPVVETFNGRSWSSASTLLTHYVVLDDVMCESWSFCVASAAPGMYTAWKKPGVLRTPVSAEIFNDNRWQVSTVRLAPPMTGIDYYGLSCVPDRGSVWCMAVGKAFELAQLGKGPRYVPGLDPRYYFPEPRLFHREVAVEIATPARAPS